MDKPIVSAAPSSQRRVWTKLILGGVLVTDQFRLNKAGTTIFLTTYDRRCGNLLEVLSEVYNFVGGFGTLAEKTP